MEEQQPQPEGNNSLQQLAKEHKQAAEAPPVEAEETVETSETAEAQVLESEPPVQTAGPLDRLQKQVQLPCGIYHKGEFMKSATIMEMTGRVKRLIANAVNQRNPAMLYDGVLGPCVLSVAGEQGSVDQQRVNGRRDEIAFPEDVLHRMLVADRDHLVMSIRQLSKGDIVTSSYTCKSCKVEQDIKIDMTQINVKPIEEVEHDVGENGIRTFNVHSDKLRIRAKFRFPNGSDHHASISQGKGNVVTATYVIMSRCMLEWGGNQAGQGAQFFEEMPDRTLEFIEQAIEDHTPGAVLENEVQCVGCGSKVSMTLEGTNFLMG